MAKPRVHQLDPSDGDDGEFVGRQGGVVGFFPIPIAAQLLPMSGLDAGGTPSLLFDPTGNLIFVEAL